MFIMNSSVNIESSICEIMSMPLCIWCISMSSIYSINSSRGLLPMNF